LTTVRVAQTGDFPLYAGLYVAKDAGLFAKHGLDVSITSTGGDEKSAAAVISHHAEFAIGDPTFAAIANQRGQNLKFVASVVDGAPFWGITFKSTVADSYARKGLAGLRVVTFPAPSTAYALQREMFLSQKLQPNIQEGAFGSVEGVLEAGRADIALELEPNVSMATARGGRVLYSMAQRAGPFAVTGVVVDGNWARSHASIIGAFCASLDEAFRIIRSDQGRTNAILVKRFPTVPAPVMQAALSRSVSEGVIPSTSAIDSAGWDNALRLRAAVGDVASVSAGRAAADASYCGSKKAL
jgi:NitT/TauT family transport system substrate-binding protein